MIKQLATTLLLIFSLHSVAQAQFGKEWLRCKTNDDCIKVSGLCGRKDAINKKFIKDFEGFLQKMTSVSSCSALTDKEKTHNEVSLPKCSVDQCKLEDPPTEKK